MSTAPEMPPETDDPTRGKLIRRVDLGRGSYVEYYKPLPGMTPLVRYKRLSVRKLKPKVQERALRRQECRPELVAANCCIVAEYCDPDHSAYKFHFVDDDGKERGKKRPAFELLSLEYKANSSGICAADVDRLTRQPLIMEQLIRDYATRSRLVFVTPDPEMDLATEQGRDNASEAARVALKEARQAQKRQCRRHSQLAEEGEYIHTRETFGWNADGSLTADAERIEDAVTWVCNGGKLGTLLRQWETDGVVSPQGNPWTVTTFKRVLTNPRLCGWRVDNRRVFETGKLVSADRVRRDESGKPFAGGMDAIITPERWEELQLALKASPHTHGGRKTKHLFSGALRCDGEGCPGRLHGQTRGAGREHEYRCGYCRKVAIVGPRTDEHLKALLRECVETKTVPAMRTEVPDWPEEQRLINARREVALIEAAYDAGEMDDQEYGLAMDARNRILLKVRRDKLKWLRENTVEVEAEVPDIDWDNPDPVKVCALLDIFYVGVWVSPSPNRGRGSFGSFRFRCLPREEPDA